VNLADLYRSQGREADGRRELERALEIDPGNAEALHATGLLRVREGRRAEALGLLRRAAAARPDSIRFAYVYAVALHDAGDAPGAIAELERAHARRPADRAVLTALVGYLRERGDPRALGYGERLAALAPGDPQARALVESLRGGRPR
jgi:tetratricopeptide (TPR) repeat protein